MNRNFSFLIDSLFTQNGKICNNPGHAYTTTEYHGSFIQGDIHAAGFISGSAYVRKGDPSSFATCSEECKTAQ